LQEGMYVGPPQMVRRGLYIGDKPDTDVARCPTCKQPLL
jgi:hypothetical protein